MVLVDQIKNVIRSGKVEYGTKKSEELILKGFAKGILISSKGDINTIERVSYYSKIGKIPIKKVEWSPKEMGEIFTLEYPVSVAVVLDEGDSKIIDEIKGKE